MPILEVMATDFSFLDHSDEVKAAAKAAAARALEICGLKAEGYAKKIVFHGGAGHGPIVQSSRLGNSITHTVADDTVYIGTNVEYAPYVELGTGKYYPGGRQTPWLYTDEKGESHWTQGRRATPYLKPAVADHAAEYKNIIKTELKGE